MWIWRKPCRIYCTIAVDLWRKPFVDQEEAVDLEDAVDHRREQRMASCILLRPHGTGACLH